jgi:hypothetical protein
VTPLRHQAIMKGCERRIERDLESALFTAWQVARYGDYEPKKRPSLADDLAKLRRGSKPRRRQTREELIAAMRAIAATVH